MWWLLSAALLAVAIGLPWRAATAGSYIPGIYFPGSTVVQATGGLYITPGFVSPGLVLPGSSALAGYQTEARPLIAAALVLLWLAVRQESRGLAVAGLATALAAPFLTAQRLSGGLLCYLLAVVFASAALRARELLTSTGATIGNRVPHEHV
jgi:hypothetical protein